MVFLTGACVLVIEVVATRILSPYYGNTIYTMSGVISVVLAALSAGYYFGGKLSDKYPQEKVFYFIILISGLAVIILYFLALLILPTTAYGPSIISGPVFSAVMLFFLPSFLLGTLSPFAVKLQARYFPEKGVGSISGEIFFWSTLGSIFGSLLAGFVLIPNFGIDRIVLAVAITLIVLGLLPLIKLGFSEEFFFKLTAFSIGAIVLAGFLSGLKDLNTVYSKDGVYEKITIYEGVHDGKPTRFFQQDRSSSGAMYLNSDELVYDYTKYYSIYKVFKPEVKNVLIIGGGAYSVPKAYLKDLPNVVVDVAEIEPSLFDLAKKYFNVKESDRLNNFTEDGRRLLHDTKKSYDVIYSDVYYSLYSVPAHFTTKEFFETAKSKLGMDGVFVANIIGNLSHQRSSLILSEIRTFRAVFPNSFFFAVESPGKTEVQNIMFVGYNSDKKIDLSAPEIVNNRDPIISSLREKNINLDRFELSAYPVLTDNYAPVDYLTSKVLRDKSAQQGSIDGNEVLAVIDQQLRYGPRFLSAPGHKNVQRFLTAEMQTLTQNFVTQSWQHSDPNGQQYELTNIIARFFSSNEKRIILATHYDSKKIADRDFGSPTQPVPGANDSASSTAVLVEVARMLSTLSTPLNVGVDIVFFDGEEGEEDQGGNYSNWKPLGSNYFAEHLDEIYTDKKPISGLVLDMVCDKDLKILMEQSSVEKAPIQTKAFWDIARKVNKNVFVNRIGSRIGDDHDPLIQAGIPTFLVIDPDYPPFHTTKDTLDKCSAESLETVAEAVVQYLRSLM